METETIAASASEEHVARCPQCSTGASWLGTITPEMIANTFTRGVTPEGMPFCPRCGTVMEIPPAPKRLRQIPLPGILPPFDCEGAFRSIIEQRDAVREAEASAERKSEAAKAARKLADAAQEKLSALEDEYAERLREHERPRRTTEERIASCAFERATGTACPICRDYPIDLPEVENGDADHVHTAAYNLASIEDLSAVDLRTVLALSEVFVDLPVVEAWSPEERKAVARWLALHDQERPAVLPPEGLTRTGDLTGVYEGDE